MKKPRVIGLKVTVKPMSNAQVAKAARSNPKLAAAIKKVSGGASTGTAGALKTKKVGR